VPPVKYELGSYIPEDDILLTELCTCAVDIYSVIGTQNSCPGNQLLLFQFNESASLEVKF
jgi:hypothetical protein